MDLAMDLGLFKAIMLPTYLPSSKNDLFPIPNTHDGFDQCKSSWPKPFLARKIICATLEI